MPKPKRIALTIDARSIAYEMRAAYVDVGERCVGLVHVHVVGPRRREEEHLHARCVLQLLDRVEGRELVHLDLASAQLQLARVLIGDVGPLHSVEVRLALLPVVGVALEGHRLSDDALVPHEGARADRMLVEVSPLLAGEVLGDDPVREQGDVGEERPPWVLEVDDDRRLVRRLDALDGGVEVAPALVLGACVVDRELHVGRRHRLAVREAHALAQLEGVPSCRRGRACSSWRATA